MAIQRSATYYVERLHRVESGRQAAAKALGLVITYLFLAIICILCLYPLVWVLLASMNADISGAGIFPWPRVWKFSGYVSIFTEMKVHLYFRNSIIVTLCSTLISVIIVSMSAYVSGRMRFKGKGLVTFMFTTTLFIPAVSISFPVYRMVKSLNLFDNMISVIFVYSGLGIAVTFFIIRNFFIGIPKEMEEAAQIDGCGFTRTFAQIILPLARPGIATAAVLVFLNNWNEFYYASLLLESMKSMTLPALVGQFTTAYSTNYNGMFAAIVVIIAPTIVLFCCMSETFVTSLAGGAVKG